jgi:hypothetical protein
MAEIAEDRRPVRREDCALIVSVSSSSETGVMVPQILAHPACAAPFMIARTGVNAYLFVANGTQLP